MHPDWQITATSFDPVPGGVASRFSHLTNLTLQGGVDATKLGESFPSGSFTDVVFNSPRGLDKGNPWSVTGNLVDHVLTSSIDVLEPGGAVRFSAGGYEPGVPRLSAHSSGDRNPNHPSLPSGYTAEPPRSYAGDPDQFGAPYTPRRNNQVTPIGSKNPRWYVFRRPR
jgi:hypothetical protein